jgi:hypothetical protein
MDKVKVVTLERKEWLLIEQIILNEDKDAALKYLKSIRDMFNRQESGGMKSHIG